MIKLPNEALVSADANVMIGAKIDARKNWDESGQRPPGMWRKNQPRVRRCALNSIHLGLYSK